MANLSRIGWVIMFDRSRLSLWHAECFNPPATIKGSFATVNPATSEDSVRMANELRTEVEQVKEQADVKRALKQTSSVKPEAKPKAETRDKLVLSTHVIVSG